MSGARLTSPGTGRPLVWMVDDSALEAEITRRALVATCDVEIFEEATTLIERLAATPRRPDTLVIDWHMPTMSGLELCLFVRSSHDASSLPIIVLTATRQRDDLLQALAAGANDYVVKPFDPEELIARVGTAVQTRRLDAMLHSAAEFRERFIGIVGHDLRQPLNTLAVGTGVLLHRNLDEADARTVRMLAKATQRMSRMIADLLDLTRSRLGGGIQVERQPMNFTEACREVVEEIRVAHPDRALDLEVSGEGQGEWDRDRVQQICANLIGNALEHGKADAPVIVRLAGDAEEVVLTVENSGNPISPELLTSLFDPFRSGVSDGRRPSRGLGLGLFIVHELTLRHGGSIVVESEPACTRFEVRLPRHAAPSSEAAPS